MIIYRSEIKSSGTDPFNVDYSKSSTNSDYDIVYNSNPRNKNVNYNIKGIFLTKLIHKNIKIGGGIDTTGTGDFIGELVIIAENGVDGIPLYLCFLIKSVNKNATDKSLTRLYENIIKVGSTATTTTISPGSDGTIPNQDSDGCIIYTDTDSNYFVVIFLNPITVLKDSAVEKYIKTEIIATENTGSTGNKYPKIPGGTSNTFIDAFSPTAVTSDILSAMTSQLAHSLNPGDNPNFKADQNIYIDCNPTGESVDRLTTYNLPISSDLMKDIDKSSFAKLCGNFAAVGLLALICYVGVPVLYKAVVKNMDSDDVLSSKQFITAFFVIIAIALYSSGNDMGSMESLMAGLMVTSVAILTYILISNEEQRNNLNSTGLDPIKLLMFSGGVIGFLIQKCMPLILVLWVVLIVIVMIIWKVAKKKDENGKEVELIDQKQMGVILGWFIVVVIPTFSGLLVQISE
jgi:preprotein translocase subunit SecG